MADRNQCDGCRRGLPVSDKLIHFVGEYPAQACTAHLYKDRPSKVELIRAMARAAAAAAGCDLKADPYAYYGFLHEATHAYLALVLMLPKGTLPA